MKITTPINQLIKFIILGVLTVAIDYTTYHFLLNYYMNIILVKGVAYLTGTIFAFFANRKWTFKDEQALNKSIRKFLILYLVTLMFNTLLNRGILFIYHEKYALQAAFIIATATSAGLNFMGMKLLVFKPVKP